MNARTPEEVHAVLEDAFNRGDLDAFVSGYEDDAALIAPPDGQVVRGHAEIRAATAPLFALRPTASIEVKGKLETDGLALTHARWSLVGTDVDGQRIEIDGRGTIVSRRRPDGTWRIVLDDPLSPD
jgi:uncharacterized protein (TIGR02246 family)